MRKFIVAFFAIIASMVLVACGGGGGSSDSSFSGTKTFGSTSFSCASESAYSSCTSSSSCSSCTCTTGCTATPVGAVITASCSVSGTTITATAAGCIGDVGGSIKTLVCDGTKLKMLSGTGLTAATVISGGSSFGGGSITLNGILITCS